MAQKPTSTYAAAGVNTDREEEALQRLVRQVRRTWQGRSSGRVVLDIGYFANVIDLGGIGLAITADGVGTKVLIAQMMDKYDTVGIDCVAMNVNDLLCVGATPVSMVDYLALDDPDPQKVEAIAQGLAVGAEQADISIAGGEMAQLRDIITSIAPHQGHPPALAFDLAGMAVGTVALDRIIIGQDIAPGDAIIGIESHGIHSNGLSLARHVLFAQQGMNIDDRPDALSCSLGEELLKPTYIYVKEALAILRERIPVKGFVHITGDGLLNLSRAPALAGYVIEQLPPTPPIFSLIQARGQIQDAEMFRVFNMGVGFCIIAPAASVEAIMAIVQSHHKKAHYLGHIISDAERRVYVEPYQLIGQGKRFGKVEKPQAGCASGTS